MHEATANGVRAIWAGEAVEDAPKTYGVEALSFVVDGKTLPFTPTGTLNFSDWSFEIFSPDGTWTVLLQDRHGPFHAVRTQNLAAYLGGGAPDRVLAYEGEGGFRPVLGAPRWEPPRTFVYEEQSEDSAVKRVELPE